MNEFDDDDIKAIREEMRLSVATREEFIALTETQDVFYEYGDGYAIEAYIQNEKEFIDFVQKCGLIELFGHWVPFFVNYQDDFDSWFYYKDTVKRSNLDTVETIGFDDDELIEERNHFFPTVKKEGLVATYNEYFTDAPFRIRKRTARIYDQDDIGVLPEVIEKFPAVVSFVSQDTFDRLGSIEGCQLEIISMKSLASNS